MISINVSDFRKDMKTQLDKVIHHQEVILLEKNGKHVATITPYDEHWSPNKSGIMDSKLTASDTRTGFNSEICQSLDKENNEANKQFIKEIIENQAHKSNLGWVKKYQAHSLKTMILPKGYRKCFKKVIDGERPNLLFHGIQGSGKTSLAKALSNDIGTKNLPINASEAGGIETLRNDIDHFTRYKTIDKKPKLIILDEADGLTPVFQKALRAFINEVKNGWFIFTCNNINSIHSPLREGRTIVFDFNFKSKDEREMMLPAVYNRLVEILKLEEVDFKEEVVWEIANKCFPDIRKMYSLLQKHSMLGNLCDKSILNEI